MITAVETWNSSQCQNYLESLGKNLLPDSIQVLADFDSVPIVTTPRSSFLSAYQLHAHCEILETTAFHIRPLHVQASNDVLNPLLQVSEFFCYQLEACMIRLSLSRLSPHLIIISWLVTFIISAKSLLSHMEHNQCTSYLSFQSLGWDVLGGHFRILLTIEHSVFLLHKAWYDAKFSLNVYWVNECMNG